MGFCPTDRPDLHHTSPGDDGRTGRNLAAPKHTATHTHTHRHRHTPTPPTLNCCAPSQPPDVVPPLPLLASPSLLPPPLPLPDSPSTVKSSELSGGMSDDCVEQSTKHTRRRGATHTSTRVVLKLFFFFFVEVDRYLIHNSGPGSHCSINQPF